MFKLILLAHLLGATVWTGGHLILAICFLPRALRERDPGIILGFEERFHGLGHAALAVQIVTGPLLAFRYVPDVAAWLSPEGTLAAHIFAKLVLLGLTLVLAVHARLRVIPRLSPERMGVLAAHIVAVTVLAVLLVVMGAGIRTG